MIYRMERSKRNTAISLRPVKRGQPRSKYRLAEKDVLLTPIRESWVNFTR